MRQLALVLLAATLAGCAGSSLWVATRAPRPEDAEAILGPEAEHGLAEDVLPHEIPDIPVRQSLRPCCAFGSEIRAEFLGIPIPGYKIPNIAGVDDLGPHRYDSGVLRERSDGEPGVEVDAERNGLVYTCRGGFVDTAHVRDYLDWGAYVSAATSKAILSGEEAVIPLPDEGGKRRIVVRPPDAETVERLGPRRVAFNLAAWISWKMSIWHEAATWYGWQSLPGFSERASAFSPEDLYSNAVGARLLEALMLRNAASSEEHFNRTATRWIDATLRMLGAVPRDVGRQASVAVDGLWWDSSKRVPDPALVIRRNFDITTPILPWLVPADRAPKALKRACAGAEIFAIAGDEVEPEIPYTDWITLEIEPEPAIASQDPFPDLPAVVTDSDLTRIVETIRAQNLVEFGPGSDRPD